MENVNAQDTPKGVLVQETKRGSGPESAVEDPVLLRSAQKQHSGYLEGDWLELRMRCVPSPVDEQGTVCRAVVASALCLGPHSLRPAETRFLDWYRISRAGSGSHSYL